MDICNAIRGYSVGAINPVIDLAAAVAVQSQEQQTADELIERDYITLTIPATDNSATKPYMDYRAVTDRSSKQYEILHKATHGSDGLLYVDGYICVALGSKYGPVGTRYLAKIGNRWYRIIKADAKAECDTINGYMGKNGHIIEVIVNTDKLDRTALVLGDCNKLLPGVVKELKREKRKW